MDNMTPTSEVIRLTQAAGFFLSIQPVDQYTVKGYLANVERIISLAKAEEREACAKASEQQIERWVDDRARYAASECASAIRARTKEAP
jgi:site-specific recombinase XerD